MNTQLIRIEIGDKQIKFAAMWIFVMFNYLYCDLMGLMDPVLLNQFITGRVGGIEFTPVFLLGAAILMEIPMAMILLSILLEFKINR
ncbi:MAG: DUF6326 family protein, partial [Anaerolineae bacterium]|nr:DUF6326 family protein [Anaerolineae bacterium]